MLYLFLGLLPSPALYFMIPNHGLADLWLGGAFYIVGILFFKADGFLPFAHAIWHGFVIVGALIHFDTAENNFLWFENWFEPRLTATFVLDGWPRQLAQ